MQAFAFFENSHAIKDAEYYSVLRELAYEQVEYFTEVYNTNKICCLDPADNVQAKP